MKQDALIGELFSLKKLQAKANGRKFRLPKTPRIRPPKPAQLSYLYDLRLMLKSMKSLTAEVIKPNLAGIIESAVSQRPKGDSLRQDDFVDLIKSAFDKVKAIFYGKYTDAEVTRIAAKAAKRTDDFNLAQTNTVFGKVLGVKIPGNETWLNQEIKAFTKTNVSLIKSIPEQYFNRIEQEVTRSAQRGVLASNLGETIQKAYGVSENRAVLIARDQVSKFNSDLTKTRQKSVGIQEYRWSTSEDDRVRPSHQEKDGQVFKWDDPPADTGHPGEDIQCRCVAIPVFDAVSEE